MMMNERGIRQTMSSTSMASSNEEGSTSFTSTSSKRSRSFNDSSDDASSPRFKAATRAPIMTRKRRLVEDMEEQLAIGEALYWESKIDLGQSDEKRGTPRRSRRGEARRRYEDVAGLKRQHQKMAVNLPPMINTREGKLLATEVFGNGVLRLLPPEDKGPRVGHCSSGYVCGHPVMRGKEGNRWCQTPVRTSLESKMACKHHAHRRRGAGSPSKEQKRYMILNAEFYDEKGNLSWPRVVSHLSSRGLLSELRHRRQVLALGGRALAVTDAKVVLHGFVQCTFFWLAVCRLTRRGYRFSTVAHASKTEFRELLADLRATAAVPPPSQVSSPFVCIDDMSCNGVRYYASGYNQVCRVF
ncbi:unnamed protein product [Ascophyllum nodosum]